MELSAILRFIIAAILFVGIPAYWLGYEKGSNIWHAQGVKDGFKSGMETALKSTADELKQLQEQWL